MTRPARRRQRPPQASLPKQFRFEQPKSPPVVVNFKGELATTLLTTAALPRLLLCDRASAVAWWRGVA
ncbi:hypothetical protein LC608_34005 [Nostoc sp. XA010]|uniref:hypothetical protein n=1 Tax=Nostoc sp. XA010 TaxID=2780407 RepID=UPI001E3A09A9|nr:hypothetical protein [Nostoc sp. XA010]MCC5661871.1 hypothetical protein [Nostoc sp. XA010]